jgi:L-malate glycosyltransferase
MNFREMRRMYKVKIAFVWDNFGPLHVDRCEAVAGVLGREGVIGIELFCKSDTYEWVSEDSPLFRKVTLFKTGDFSKTGNAKTALAIVASCRKNGVTHAFLCHYDQPAILLASFLLRLSGIRVYTMSCSKFDDVERNAARELLKKFFFLPYQGAISSGTRAKDYMRFMGIAKDLIATEYNTLSVSRIRKMAGHAPAPAGLAFGGRHFTIVARLVPKKNLMMALDAYAIYRASAKSPRTLHLCGSGHLERELRDKVEQLDLTQFVVFRGFLQTNQIAEVLGESLALLLPSIEEQFGNVVIEAQAMGLPTILSDNCGARDRLVRSGVNGFVIEPDSPAGMAFFMAMLSDDEMLWRKMSMAAGASSEKGDVARFSEAVVKLVGA